MVRGNWLCLFLLDSWLMMINCYSFSFVNGWDNNFLFFLLRLRVVQLYRNHNILCGFGRVGIDVLVLNRLFFFVLLD